jgi:hypothetical protein
MEKQGVQEGGAGDICRRAGRWQTAAAPPGAASPAGSAAAAVELAPLRWRLQADTALLRGTQKCCGSRFRGLGGRCRAHGRRPHPQTSP